MQDLFTKVYLTEIAGLKNNNNILESRKQLTNLFESWIPQSRRQIISKNKIRQFLDSFIVIEDRKILLTEDLNSLNFPIGLINKISNTFDIVDVTFKDLCDVTNKDWKYYHLFESLKDSNYVIHICKFNFNQPQIFFNSFFKGNDNIEEDIEYFKHNMKHKLGLYSRVENDIFILLNKPVKTTIILHEITHMIQDLFNIDVNYAVQDKLQGLYNLKIKSRLQISFEEFIEMFDSNEIYPWTYDLCNDLNVIYEQTVDKSITHISWIKQTLFKLDLNDPNIMQDPFVLLYANVIGNVSGMQFFIGSYLANVCHDQIKNKIIEYFSE